MADPKSSSVAASSKSQSVYSKYDALPRSITSTKLNGHNYLSWAHAVKVYLRGQRQTKFITDLPPAKGDAALPDWEQEDSLLMGQFWHSLEPHVAITVEFCDTTKQIWDALADCFSQQNNVSRVFELYEKIFTTKQSGKPLFDYYSTLKSLWDQLLQHRPFTSNIKQQQRYSEDFMVASLLIGLDFSLGGFKDQILASETFPTIANSYSRLSRSSLGQSSTAPHFVASAPESSALVTSGGFCGTSWGNGRCGSGDRTSGRNGTSGRVGGSNFHGRSCGDGRIGGWGECKCDHCGANNHTEPYCWKKYGKSDYVHHVPDSSPPLPSQLSALPSDSLDALTTQVGDGSDLSSNLIGRREGESPSSFPTLPMPPSSSTPPLPLSTIPPLQVRWIGRAAGHSSVGEASWCTQGAAAGWIVFVGVEIMHKWVAEVGRNTGP
ncbi:hypothetical protein Vadar_014893 [Vaccinium darrowii]|uniref:Uncharacterized protein n=1 Tax=Vaccinium darrowii TaxID=229202 RepID=A0ACB7X9V2_9ERIC|nr:hypothetical protein Vadar_014893 [Vaccinium darrowii]